MTTPQTTRNELDGSGIRDLIAATCRALRRNQAEINALNVFPVPDGDTGTNMCLTLEAVLEGIELDAESTEDEAGESAGVVMRSMANAALLGARGNSGLILAQYFSGLASAFDGASHMTGDEFTAGLAAGADAAYKAVENPVEGTLLTVMREAANGAFDALDGDSGLANVLEAAATSASTAVEKTPDQMELLARAGVVDAGGHGFAVMLTGASSFLKGESDGEIEIPAPITGGGISGDALREFLADATEVEYGYCTSFVMAGDDLDVDDIREMVTSLGESCVVAGDSSQIKIHVHPQNPGPVLEYAANIAALSHISIANMDEQTRQRAAEIPDDARPPVPLLDTFVTAVVAVANGPGLRDIFVESGMGASSVVQGGDSLNPSVGDLLKAVNAAPADAVVVLPNNPNIIGTARQLDDLTDKRVDVIPTSCMQEGIAALLAFSPDRDLALNVESILEAVEFICSASLTTATRDVELDGTLVKTGDKIGLLDGKVAAASDTHAEVARQLFRQPSVDGELVTIYRGEHSSEEEAAEIASIATQSLNSVEVEIVYGGQPHYPYLIAIE